MPPIELLESTHTFPGPYTFKVIGKAERGFAARAVAAVRDALAFEADPPFTTREATGGRHVALALTAPEIGGLLSAVEGSALVRDPDAPAAANVREIRRAYDRAVKLPKELVEELARTTTQAQQVWQKARKDSDFPSFAPWLDKIVR